ncbi:MAG: HAMP domain-containing histidine kinase [Bacteroidales bacterium]|nr:HAMP domain-containing histidine kinase [Bacteroidales bacterium]
MNIYHRKQRWKIYLLLAALFIVVGSYWFTNNLTRQLAEEERKKVELWAQGMKELTQNRNLDKDYSFILEVIRNNETVPMILTDEKEKMISMRNVHIGERNQEREIQELIAEMKQQHEPIEINLPQGKQYIFYKDSTLLTRLSYFPFIQLGVVALFLLISYYAFSTARKAEQNQVWVGMSKETAHQLGTPTTSLLANLELLRMTLDDQSIIGEIEKDINRLEKITERFSKIGSQPALKSESLPPILSGVLEYIRTRTSKRVSFNLNFREEDDLQVPLNKPLFEWVVENLLKNAIDSMDGDGVIDVQVHCKGQQVMIDVSDQGKGISRSKQKAIFQPGYTTKTRGWGLGLSLAKRIIEQYHKGKIFVHHSEPGKGTTLRMILKR